MIGRPNAQFRHLGLYVRDLSVMADFYQRILGLAETDRGLTAAGGTILFLSRSASEHHQIVLIEGRTEAMGSGPINQLSFRLDSLDDLLRFYRVIRAEGVRFDKALNHGNAWSLYCFDPEGNRIELYAGSPWHVAQPCAAALDLDEPPATIVARTEAMVQADPTWATREDWSRRQAGTLGISPATDAA